MLCFFPQVIKIKQLLCWDYYFEMKGKGVFDYLDEIKVSLLNESDGELWYTCIIHHRYRILEFMSLSFTILIFGWFKNSENDCRLPCFYNTRDANSLKHRRSSVICRNGCREEHLSNTFRLYYWENYPTCTLHLQSFIFS